ncbi:MAG: hypothetical protein GOMPHAMPRED_007839 [Gomphillus americanus]|uniref:Uncharacterized protein n=1 Tax=Gomphillus americanus TaxID=1940652 RepID=A0A8H3EV52_9LECA|nr:MAG: hypothetical protein GOMPHAMPRED_007839 [Gomphillus americanus]
MVETRSRRRISPASNGVSETLTRPKPKKSSQAKDQGSANVVRVDDPEILKSITLQPGASLDGILTTQPKQLDPGSAQSLPHRSRGSKQLVDEAQPTGETPPGSMDTDKAADSYEEMEQSHSDVTVEVTEDATMIKQTSQVTIKEMESGTGSEDHVISVSTQEKNAKRKRSSKSEPSSKKIHSASISNHKRFGSEDPVPELKVPQAHVEDLRMSNQSEIVDDESEDDIPEEVTAVTAAQEAKASATKTAQSIKMQKETDRAKRQRRDLALKTQAQASKKRKVESNLQETLNGALDTVIYQAETYHNHMEDLPDELPAEILALEPEPSIALPNNSSERRQRPNKRKRLDQDLKPTKDVRIGNTNIRVLPSPNISLPPPAGHRTSNVKEAWLRARIKESKGKMAGYKIKGAGARSFLCQPNR